MHIDWAKKEILFKIVYYGPGLSGKTTNLEFIHAHLDDKLKSDLISLKTREDRTLFFDFMQLDLDAIQGRKPRFFLYTTPGQVHYGFSRKLILNGADAVVFVADSQRSRMDANLDSLMDLETKLINLGKTLARFPWVLQYNKRDCSSAESIGFLQRKLNFLNVPYFEATAITGDGVFETLKSVITLVFEKMKD
ncbi:gliding-motility protein MglA [candidate division KSB1 bacterium]|jgi:hypothetical protein|nr:gliding-motility protein MglA [candidate division KSB1 bacterium]